MSFPVHSGSWSELQTWLASQSRVRAVICDVYGTLLEVFPGPPNVEALWQQKWNFHCPSMSFLSLESLEERSAERIRASHQKSLARGVLFPEVDWEEIMDLPQELIFEHARLIRRCVLANGAAPFLKFAKTAGIHLGLSSNGQRYTEMELAGAMQLEELKMSLFEPSLTFWSWRHGFSKPNPAAFALLSGNAQKFGVSPAEILMVGDRLDNDVLPALSAGWQGWQLKNSESSAS